MPSPRWGNNKWRSEETPPKAKPNPTILSPRAHHGGLEGGAGECGSCRLSFGSGSRRLPTVCAISWNMDLSKLSQSEGSLEGGSRALAQTPGSPTPSTYTTDRDASHLFVGRASR